jgi:predicted aldo/keto reductase-like oxidoreductase
MQYESAMLPPRSEIQALEDDILKQVNHQQQQLQKWLLACTCCISCVPCPTNTASSQSTFLFVQMQTGMEKANASQILMLPTYVTKLPTG